MKKLLIVLAMVVLFASVVSAQETKQTTISFTQVLPSPNDLKDFRIYHATVTGGPYTTPWFTIPVVVGQTSYSTTHDLVVPAGSSTHCFVVDNIDISGNASGKSNEICKTTTGADTTPGVVPVLINIVIQ